VLWLVIVACGLLPLAGCSLGEEDSGPPQVGGVKANDDQAVQDLGFPSSATRNTVRVGGDDSASTAAGVASALFPATGDADRPSAIALVDQDDWSSGIAASVLVGSPIGAPILLADGDQLPEVTKDTLERLEPKGSELAKNAQVIRIGSDVARPAGLRTAVIEGGNQYELAASIDRFVSAARGKPSGDVVVYSGDKPEYAMPAAAWGARSGDAALPVPRNSVPKPIASALKDHERPNIFVLGPESVISKKAFDQLGKLGRSVRRIEGPSPVENAIAFARYRKGDFGWGVVVPGYNFAIANLARPLDAAAGAALGTNGVFAPLLLTDDAARLPEPLDSYLLSVQPGYEDSPSDAVYNHVWILGDDKAVSVPEQARIDEITELVPVQASGP
jgi:hypothetical protein